jgi:hypothetical protein
MAAVALKNQLNAHIASMFAAVSFLMLPSPHLSGEILALWHGGILADRGGPIAGESR